MKKTLNLEIDDVTAVLYFLDHCVEIHFTSNKSTFIESVKFYVSFFHYISFSLSLFLVT